MLIHVPDLNENNGPYMWENMSLVDVLHSEIFYLFYFFLRAS